MGQDHLLQTGGVIARMVDGGQLRSLLLWGPPGCGKTTLARLLAQAVGLHFEPLSAVMAGVPELRKVFEGAEKRHAMGAGTVLFVDEIHRFNRAQQDALLPYVENGTVILLGATTENPSFALNAALLSRCQVLVLKRLDDAALTLLMQRAEAQGAASLQLDEEARALLRTLADGDGRYLLSLCEDLLAAPPHTRLDSAALLTHVEKRAPLYDKGQDNHYNLISALHKSLRGSDVDAALYWFARMLAGGEDPNYIARRLLRFASEDIGLADPQAMPQMLAAWQAFERLGQPEGELALVQGLIYLATAPKSNAAYRAYHAGQHLAHQHGSLMPPKHILNAPTQLMRDEGYGKDYAYDHDAPDAFSGQNYFPDGMARHQLYHPNPRGHEREISKRLEYWQKLREARQ